MTGSAKRSGPLAGVRVLHLASLGPGPYAAMLLADLGGDVMIIDRPMPLASSMPPEMDPRRRGQRSIVLNLKKDAELSAFLCLADDADVLIEGMRPGTAERMGVGPDTCLRRNPRLVYARMTGWGQVGPLAQAAGHDINYVALTGALHAMGDADRPPAVPLNLLGDYAGGGMYLALGVLAALFERAESGRGQVVDGAIVDGVASLTTATLGMIAAGRWGPRGASPFDGSMPWYRTYRTRDDKFVAVGAIEDRFFAALLEGVGLDPRRWPRNTQADRDALTAELARIFATRDRAFWQERFEGTDACVTPVLTFSEAAQHPHHTARQTYQIIAEVTQPSPGPRFSRTVLSSPANPAAPGQHDDQFPGWRA